MSDRLKIGLIGCGVIGKRRLEVIRQTGLGEVGGVYDPDEDRAKELAALHRTQMAVNPLELCSSEVVNGVIVATPNASTASYAIEALKHGKHAFLEKPAAISHAELRRMQTTLAEAPLPKPTCKIGYNHRFHPAAHRMHEELSSGRHGSVLWLRATYGHGGRPSYEKEWRFQRELSGGGVLLDQGVHILDLIQWWCGSDFELVHASRLNTFYPSNVEDNGFLLLQSATGVVGLPG